MASIQENPVSTLTIDLEAQTLWIDGSNLSESFEIDSYKKLCLINGYDDIDFLISQKEAIENFEQKRVKSL